MFPWANSLKNRVEVVYQETERMRGESRVRLAPIASRMTTDATRGIVGGTGIGPGLVHFEPRWNKEGGTPPVVIKRVRKDMKRKRMVRNEECWSAGLKVEDAPSPLCF